jgi:spore maturation protein CgeB
MRVAIFCHSVISDWNHGNAHFLRGIAGELQARGHDLRIFEPRDAWSLCNLVKDSGTEAIEKFREAFPSLNSTRYLPGALDLDEALDGADIVIVHEWNDPDLVERIGIHRARGHRYILLFHDTHHRSVTDRHAMERYCLKHYDGVLAFGDSVAERYRAYGWGRRVWTWHEAADIRVFHPMPRATGLRDLIWIGNWGDDERAGELSEFLIEPATDLRLRARVHGVRYPESAIRALAAADIQYAGWIANYEVPKAFAQFKFTVHVPRRPYAEALHGVPTIRMFEALACGMPLISAPWSDVEGLFSPGEDFLFAENGIEMKRHMRALLSDPELRASLGAHGRQTILERHTCAHRVDELLDICREIGGAGETVQRPASAGK